MKLYTHSDGKADPWFHNFVEWVFENTTTNNVTIELAKFNGKCTNLGGKTSYAEFEFETEEDMINFLLKWS